MPDVLAVSLNPAVDRIALVPRGSGTVRATTFLETPGGKGAHVALVARDLGAEGELLTVVGGRRGELLMALIEAEGLPLSAMHVAAETRGTYTVVTPDGGAGVEVLEPSPVLSRDEAECVVDMVSDNADEAAVVAICGSMPAGAPPGLIARLIEAARQDGAYVMVDVSGPALVESLAAAPDLVKPNVHEARTALGLDTDDPVVLAHALRARGARAALVTAGADGAVLATADETLHGRAPVTPHVNSVGCGDAVTAGFAVAMARGASAADALALGLAAAADKLSRLHPGHVERASVERLVADVSLTRIEAAA